MKYCYLLVRNIELTMKKFRITIPNVTTGLDINKPYVSHETNFCYPYKYLNTISPT